MIKYSSIIVNIKSVMSCKVVMVVVSVVSWELVYHSLTLHITTLLEEW